MVGAGLIVGFAAAVSTAETQAASDDSEVVVVRGANVERVAFESQTTSLDSGVVVIRGAPPEKGEIDERDSMRGHEQYLPRWQVVGGKRLWFLDNFDGNVIACYLASTGYVGERVVRCTSQY
jgi:hypothetical protein